MFENIDEFPVERNHFHLENARKTSCVLVPCRNKITHTGAGQVAQMVEHLPGKHEALSSNCSTKNKETSKNKTKQKCYRKRLCM
jgi:hypothetical protein